MLLRGTVLSTTHFSLAIFPSPPLLKHPSMPSVGTNYNIDVYTSAVDLPPLVWETFRAHPCDSNVIFPYAEMSREQQCGGKSSRSLWIICTTYELCASPTIDFVLSCTEGFLGSYPIFIFTTLSRHDQISDYAHRRLASLVKYLARQVPSERVFSIFAPDEITKMFATLWTEETGIGLDMDATYYAANISYCTRQSFRRRQDSILPGVDYSLRLATEADISRCAQLCYGFAEESVRTYLNNNAVLYRCYLLGTFHPQ
jgi:hypothetical protein